MKMNSENLDELVFENRNKEYGAYVIRKEYARSLKTGMFVTFASVGFLVLCSFVIKTKTIIEPGAPEIIPDSGIVVVLPPPPMPPPPDAPKEPGGRPKSNVFIPFVTDRNADTAHTVLPQDIPTVPGSTGPETAFTGPPTDGPVGPPIIAPPPTAPPPTLVPDEMPDVEGGIMKYLRKHLTYPESAVQKKTTGTVYVSFVVERDGSVGNINVLKGIGDGCEEEATRVIKKMRWKPGKNHGIPVRVQFTLPVKFTINE
jgi:protein TonB